MTWLDDSVRSEDLQKLAAHLRRVPKLSQAVGRDDVDEDAWAIAHGLRDIVEDARRLAAELVPRLLQLDPSDARAEELLYEIGETLRHIRYHTSNSRFYSYLAESPGAEDDRDRPD